MELGPFDEFEDAFGDDGETYSQAPHPDDRLWRHPSEIAAELAAANAAETAPLATASSARSLSGTPNRLALALAGVATLLVVAGGSQLLFAGSPAQSVATGTFQSSATTSAAIGPVSNTANGADSENTGSSNSNADNQGRISIARSAEERSWVGALRDRVEPQMPKVMAVSNAHMRNGHGLFVDSSGFVLTSASLIAEAEAIVVQTSSGGRYPAVLIGFDLDSDLALLDIDGTNHPVADLSNTSKIRVGQHTLAATESNPAGMDIGQVVFVASQRVLPSGNTLYGTFEVDIASSELMPGSALFNDTGAVMGIVSSTAAADGNAAIVPISVARRVSEDLRSHGAVHRASIGADLAESNAPVELTSLGFDPKRDIVVTISALTTDGPSHAAGLNVEDYIIRVAGQRVTSEADIIAILRDHSPGDVITVEVARGGTRFITEVQTSLLGD